MSTRLVPAQAVPNMVRRAFSDSPEMAAALLGHAKVRVAQRPISANTYWADPDMCQLLLDAAEQLTEPVYPQSPCELGLMILARPTTAVIRGVPCTIRGVGWNNNSADRLLDVYILGDNGHQIYMLGHLEDQANQLHLGPSGRLLAAFWLLLQQEGLIRERSQQEVTAPPSRRGGRTQRRPRPAEVRVVTLRPGTDHARAYAGRGDTPREYQHRWVVNGHWRQQPYPSLGRNTDGTVVTKQIYIAPHLKGPEGAPLLRTPKVTAVRSSRG